ncbi:uncharacterized protein LOC113850897 [Abrus precatorius]|uniref:Uncharacterized protein LOC113850897 n=1 Tax=Abrus precatorius TaxID=3816 RepID=A0A8B8K0H6_ABRPR|nr:uncharacterized protein LOC113850897 [Abrus precatorius]
MGIMLNTLLETQHSGPQTSLNPVVNYGQGGTPMMGSDPNKVLACYNLGSGPLGINLGSQNCSPQQRVGVKSPIAQLGEIEPPQNAIEGQGNRKCRKKKKKKKCNKKGKLNKGIVHLEEELVKPFSLKEIRDEIWSCEGNKSLGPDGCPQHLNEFWHVSLIGCMYKCIAKCLSIRLEDVIAKLVSDNQSTFVGGRNMLDGVVVANETIDFVKNERNPCLVFKVDFEKAYDSVNWGFLDYMLGRFGFYEKWRSWIRGCLHSSKVSILVNGSPSLEFPMGKGLHQGDPLASILFILMVEGFGALMKSASFKGFLKRIDVVGI